MNYLGKKFRTNNENSREKNAFKKYVLYPGDDEWLEEECRLEKKTFQQTTSKLILPSVCEFVWVWLTRKGQLAVFPGACHSLWPPSGDFLAFFWVCFFTLAWYSFKGKTWLNGLVGDFTLCTTVPISFTNLI